MGFVWGLLTNKLTGPIATAAALLFFVLFLDAKADGAGVARDLRADLAKVEGDLKVANRDLTQCKTNKGVLEASVKRQGEEIERVAREGRERTAAAQREADAARAAAVTANRRADRILAALPTDPDLCVAADALILGEAR